MTRPSRLTPLVLAVLTTWCAVACTPSSDDPTTNTDSPGVALEDLPPTERLEPPDFYLGGIQIHEAAHDDWFAALKAQGFNAVEITDYAKQGDWDTDHMWWDEEAPWVVREMRGAREAGLHTVLILRVALDHAFERNAFLWHGMIMPKSNQLIDSWFSQYTEYVVKWARLAEHHGVDALMIGSEMNALASTLPIDEIPALEEFFLNDDKQEQRREQVLAHREAVEQREMGLRDQERFDSVEQYLDARQQTEHDWAARVAAAGGVEAINQRRQRLQQHWIDLIAAVRQEFTGQVGYAANFDQYHEVGFWHHLDILGINAYFKLRDRILDDDERDQLYPTLVDGWRGVLGGIAEFRTAQNLDETPVMFTEMGFTYRAQSTLEPWSDTGFSLIRTPTVLDDGREGEPVETMIVWRQQPDDYEERALAIRALYEAHGEFEQPFLDGILYWKLSSHDYHKKDESFMIHVGEGSTDPALAELRFFVD